MTVAFYAACKVGNLDAAEHLLTALEFEVARSVRLGRDKREDGNDLAAVRARLQLERHRQTDGSRVAGRPVASSDPHDQVTTGIWPPDAA
jgi:hypothetical protein